MAELVAETSGRNTSTPPLDSTPQRHGGLRFAVQASQAGVGSSSDMGSALRRNLRNLYFPYVALALRSGVCRADCPRLIPVLVEISTQN